MATDVPDQTLRNRQAALVGALVAGEPIPPGFDRRMVRAAEAALLDKRAGEVAGAWPCLAAALDEQWDDRFRGWARGRPSHGALRDGWDLARELDRLGQLPPLALVELALREAAARYDGRHTPRRRRLPYLRRVPGGLVVGFLGRVRAICRG
jgi:hypothetical protein